MNGYDDGLLADLAQCDGPYAADARSRIEALLAENAVLRASVEQPVSMTRYGVLAALDALRERLEEQEANWLDDPGQSDWHSGRRYAINLVVQEVLSEIDTLSEDVRARRRWLVLDRTALPPRRRHNAVDDAVGPVHRPGGCATSGGSVMARRPGYDAPDASGVDWRDCTHEWHPVSMVFETQMLDPEGRVLIRQPDAKTGRVYIVCLRCGSHTYMPTKFIYRLNGPDDGNEAEA